MSNDEVKNQNDDVLERNVAQLMAHSHQPPRIDDQARARVLTSLKERVRAKAKQPVDQTTPRSSSAPRWLRFGVVGVGVAAIAASALLFLRSGDSPTARRLDNAGPGPRLVALADGSEVVLASGASLVVDHARRRATLDRGEAMFDIAPAAGKTFVVDAPHGRVTVLGTRFVIADEDDATTASVVRGVVRLENGSGGETLHAGEQGVARAGGRPQRRRAPRLSHLASWAQAARIESEKPDEAPARNGVLLARQPNWQDLEFPLPMRELTVDIHVEDQVARVAVDQTFFNPQPSTLEGVYRFPLPTDASIARLAMYVDGKRMDSAVVERTRGREIYESIVYQRRDPALLEWMNGNLFQLRIFPLPGRTEKRLALQYTQSLQRLYGDYAISVPIPEVDEPVGRVRYQARIVGCAACVVTSTSHEIETRRDGDDTVVSFERTGYRIGDDLLLSVRDGSAGARVARFHGPKHDYLGWRVQPTISDAGDGTGGASTADAAPGPRRWVILHDTSASRSALERKAQGFVIDRLLREVDEDDEIQIVAFDARVRSMAAGFQRVADVDRRAVARFLAAESVDGIGFTDLGHAIDEALRLLGAAPAGKAPHILYLGDGIVTGGDRAATALAAKLGDRATFVGVALGDTQDAVLLRRLAAATGGLAVSMNPGDDLGWRAFDLVAALNTPRVVGLTAELETTTGAVLPIAVYADGAQLSDGEDLSIVAQVDDAAIARLTLRGRRNGAPWSQSFAIADAASAGGQAAYLPRLWAQRRIDALRVEDEVASAVAVDPADTTAASEAAARRAEMTELGTNHFLLTPYTSLLVLENDAMYKEFAVKRDWRQDFAEYPLPDTIPVVYEPLPNVAIATAPIDALLVRSPIEMFASYGYYDYRGSERGGAFGLGRTGTLGAGGGGNAGPMRESAFSALEDRAEEIATEAKHAPAQPDSGSSGTGDGYGAVDKNVAYEKSPAAKELVSRPVTITTGALRSQREGGFVVGGKDASFEVGADASGGSRFGWDGDEAKGKSGKKVAAGWRGTRTRGHGRGYYAPAVPQPIAFHYAADPRLDDLTELVPGMFTIPIDADLAGLRARGDVAGTISDEARELLVRARAAAPSASYRWANGQLLETGPNGLAIERRLPTGLVERIRWDGTSLMHDYHELDLTIRRDVADGGAVVVDHLAPMWLAEPAALARWYDVTASGRVITLRRAATPLPAGATDGKGAPATAAAEPAIELELDAALRLVEVRIVDGAKRTVIRHLEWGTDRVTIVEGDARTEIAITADRREAARLPSPTVVVELPLRTPAFRLEELGRADDASWRHAAHQLLASQVAVGDVIAVRDLVAQMVKAPEPTPASTPVPAKAGRRGPVKPAIPKIVPLSRGELLLAARGVMATEAKQRDRILAATADAPIAAYLRASAAQQTRIRAASFDAVVVDAGGGLISSMAAFRAVLASLWEDAPRAAVDKRLGVFSASCADPTLRYILASVHGGSWAWRDVGAAVSAWDSLTAESSFATYGRHETARLLYSNGKYDEAATRVEQMLGDGWVEDPVPIDYIARYSFEYSRRGPSGWNLVWSRLRQRALASDDPWVILSFLDAAQQIGQAVDLDRAAARIAELAIAAPPGGAPSIDAATALEVADSLLSAGRPDQASTLIAPWLAPDKEPGPALLERASAIAERQERWVDAAGLLERALAARDDGIELSVVRGAFTRLLDLRRRAAQATLGAARDEQLAHAVTAAAAWRELDPSNAAIERAMAELLYSVERPEEAWRYLSTAIERGPADGDSYRIVAEVLEREGKLEDAAALWQHAAEVDPTNPTWLLRQAQARFALGQEPAGDALIETIVGKAWHERFVQVVAQARNLRKHPQLPQGSHR